MRSAHGRDHRTGHSREQLRARGFSVIDTDDQGLSITNPFNPALVEAVNTRDGLYVTGWGYELGESGNEAGTAQRLAFLLSPSRATRVPATSKREGRRSVQQPRERHFTSHPASAAHARTFVADALTAWELDDRLDDVLLCVSELATT